MAEKDRIFNSLGLQASLHQTGHESDRLDLGQLALSANVTRSLAEIGRR
jgi:hypothetical protein